VEWGENKEKHLFFFSSAEPPEQSTELFFKIPMRLIVPTPPWASFALQYILNFK